MLVAPVPLIVMLAGLVIYFACTQNGKLARVGEHMLWTGLLVTLMSTASKVVHLP